MEARYSCSAFLSCAWYAGGTVIRGNAAIPAAARTRTSRYSSAVASIRACRLSVVGTSPSAWTAAPRTRGDGSLAARSKESSTSWSLRRRDEANQRGSEDFVALGVLDVGEHLRQLGPVPLAGGGDERSALEDRRLVVPGPPLPHEPVGPRRGLVGVAVVAGVRRLVRDRRRRRRRGHRVIAAVHPRERGLRHVAGDALAALALREMVRVRRRGVHLVLVAGDAGVVELLLLEPVAAAGGVAVHAVDLPRLEAGAHAPGGVGVVLPEVAAVGVEVGVLERHEVEVVVEPFLRLVRERQRAPLRVATQSRGRCVAPSSWSWCG